MTCIAEGESRQIFDFLVIDAQGAEFLFLQGAKGLLSPDSLQGAMIELQQSLCMTRLG